MPLPCPPLIDANALSLRLGDPDLVLLDATFVLPAEPRNPAQEFASEHLEGARYFDIETLKDPSSPLPHMLPSASLFAQGVGELGISNESEVIVYDNNHFMAAARAWWMFRAFGHTRVRVLDGGLAFWKRQCLPTTDRPSVFGPTQFKSSQAADLVKTRDDLVQNLETSAYRVIDARPADRFKGLVDEPRAGLRRGHIPHSRSLFFKQLLDPETGCLLEKARLRAAFEAVGCQPGDPVIATCGSGVTAAILALALAHLGDFNVQVYDGSWAEWGLPGETPVMSL